jgi:hypothetical protein
MPEGRQGNLEREVSSGRSSQRWDRRGQEALAKDQTWRSV